MRVGFVRNVGLVALSLAVAAVAACNDDPLSSSDKEDTTYIFTNPSVMTIAAGVPTKVTTVAQNNVGEPTWEQVTYEQPSCAAVADDPDRLVDVQPPGLLVVTGNSTVATCALTVTSGAATSQIDLKVVGADLALSCPTGVRAGDSGTIGASLVDAGGNPMGPFDQATDLTWDSDNDAVVTVDQAGNWTSEASGSATISISWSDPTGSATLEQSCQIQVGGDIPDSAAFPAADTLGNLGVIFLTTPAEIVSYEVLVFDVFGNVTSLASEITDISVTTADPAVATASGVREVPEGSDEVLLSVEVTPVGAGTTTISGTVETSAGNLPFSGTIEVVLIPTITASSPESGIVGEVVTLDVVDYDPASQGVFIDGSPLDPIFIESESPTQIVFWMPNPGLGDHEIAIGGSAEALSNAVPFELTSGASADDPAYLDPSTAPLTDLPLKKVSYLSPDVLDHFYLIEVAAATTIVIDLDWDSGSDLDILVTDGAYTAYVCTDGATGAQPEQSVCDLPAAGQYLIWINDYDASRASYVLEAAVQ